MIANSFNRQFTTSKLGKHSSSRRSRQVSNDVKRLSLEEAESFTRDQNTTAIKSCRSSRAYGPNSLSIFHLKNLGPLYTEHLTALYNDSLLPPSIDLEDLISHPNSQARQGLITRHLLQNHLAAMPSSQGPQGAHLTLLSTNLSHQLKINTASDPDTRLHLPSSSSQQTSHRTVCMAIDLTAVVDTVSHDILISKIAGLSLPPAITRWLSCYLRIVGTGVPQGSKLSPSLFNYYIADMLMPMPTSPVKRVCCNNSRLHVVEPPRRRSFIWQIGVNSSIQDQCQVCPRCIGLESVMRVNAASLHIRATTTSTSGTLNDLTTDLIMANNDNNTKRVCYTHDITVWASGPKIPQLESMINSFNRQFTTSKLGKHSSSRRSRHVSNDVKRLSLEEAESFTRDQNTTAIKSCRSSRAYGPNSLSIFHLKNLGPLYTEHLTSLYNDSLLPPSIDLEDLISHPNSQARQGLITRHLL